MQGKQLGGYRKIWTEEGLSEQKETKGEGRHEAASGDGPCSDAALLTVSDLVKGKRRYKDKHLQPFVVENKLTLTKREGGGKLGLRD